MDKFKLFFILLISSFSVCYLHSQNTNLHYTIQWQEKQSFYYPEEQAETLIQKFLLYFDGAFYNYDKHYLPIFSSHIKVDGDNWIAQIKNAQFASLSNEEIALVVDIGKIQNTIEIKNFIRYNRKQPTLEFSFVPLRKNPLTGQYEKLTGFDISLTPDNKSVSITKKLKKETNQSVLATGKWIKIKIKNSGIYKLTFDELINIGIDQPEKVRIFGNGGKMLPWYNSEVRPDDLIENYIWIKNNTIYFYGDGTAQWKYNATDDFFEHQLNLYSDYAYYFLSSDYTSGLTNSIPTEVQSTGATTHTVVSFTDAVFHEIDTANLIHSGRLWVGEHFDFQTDYNFHFELPNLISGSTIKLKTSLIARSPVTSSFILSIDDKVFSSTFNSVSYDYTAPYASQKVQFFDVLAANTTGTDIGLKYNKSTASSEAWLDYLCVNAQRKLLFTNKPLRFRSQQSVGSGNISLFQLSNASSQTIIWDITNPQKPKQIETNLNGSILSFKLSTDSLREFIAFEESMAQTPEVTGENTGLISNQNLHGIGQADFVIISHPEFMDQATELKEIHQAEGKLSISLLDVQQVYNEFSSGAPDVSAIRNFMKMLYNRAPTPAQLPKYLCLFGDGSFDNKNNFPSNSNFILTYQSDNSLSPTLSFVTDDYYGLLDDNEGGHEGLLDIGIGRIPVKTKTEASAMIQKIRNYLSIEAHADWKNRICFIADDEDNNIHQRQADQLSKIVNNNYPFYNIEKIFLDAYVQQSSSAGQRYPDVNLAIDNQINKGLLVINYTGHGNENGLTEERIITSDQINKWNNQYKLPIFMTATCEFSRFDNYKKTSAGELVYLNPKGGAIAMFTTTRLVYASPNFELNQNFYKYLFENNPLTNEKYRLGDIMRLTKTASGSEINKRNFTLFGDPALELGYANLMVRTNSINDAPAIGVADTLKAFDKITIKGEIQDQNGLKLNNYNGTIFPIVYDKKIEVKSLNNDGSGVFTFDIRNSQLFKGKASVNNGNFQFSFIVPKDIRYNVDTGKISYYSTNYQQLSDSKGSFQNLLIGGLGNSDLNDIEGPKIQLYLNDENFVNGGITNNSPKLLSFLTDESGINTTGNGIGHDIVATIDDKTELQFTLNDYYESDIDNFTSGKINYSFPELEPGEHKLHLKAWDINNNSSEDSLIFYVVDNQKFEINHVLNYPNPFSTNTSFFFEHNRPNEPLEVFIHVFTVTGKIVKTIHTEIISNGFRSEGVPWDGRDDFGNKIGRGVYFYKLAVRTLSGEKVDRTEKLLILN